MEQREWKEAEDTFKELRQEAGSKNDLYAILAQGAIPLNSLSGNKRKVLDASASCCYPSHKVNVFTGAIKSCASLRLPLPFSG